MVVDQKGAEGSGLALIQDGFSRIFDVLTEENMDPLRPVQAKGVCDGCCGLGFRLAGIG